MKQSRTASSEEGAFVFDQDRGSNEPSCRLNRGRYVDENHSDRPDEFPEAIFFAFHISCLLAESPKTFLLLDGPKTLDVENRSVS
jgi:hypothetical protein